MRLALREYFSEYERIIRMKDWLIGLLGENTVNVGGFILILALIIGAVFVVLAFLRRIGGGSFNVGGRNASLPRLSVMDAAPVDAKRKLVLIRRDNVEHLLLIGGPTDLVVEQNINKELLDDHKRSPSRIDPDDIERFRQRETSSGASVDSTIQLNSPIERSEPVVPKISTVAEKTTQALPDSQQSVSPVAHHIPRREPQAREIPVTPRPAPSYPPQPRQVLPAQSSDSQPSPKLHPAYPLSQVSRGVLTSTSGTSTPGTSTSGTSTSGATISPSAGVDLGKVNPAEEALPPQAVRTYASEPAAVQNKAGTEPSLSSGGVKSFTGVGSSDPRVDNSVAPVTDSPSNRSEDTAELFDSIDFETELLGSLDISPIEPKDHSIEDEMEKLLGDLSKEHSRNT